MRQMSTIEARRLFSSDEIDQVDPNPDQPRQVLGDLSELMASITEKGILGPLIVRQLAGGATQGGRSGRAAGVPVVIREVESRTHRELAAPRPRIRRVGP